MRVAGSLADAHNAGGGIALEHGAILGKCELARRVLRRLPVGVVRAALHIVNRLAAQLERNAQFHQRLHFALAGEDALSWAVRSSAGGRCRRTIVRRLPGP